MIETIEMLRSVFVNAQIKASRNRIDLMADRIRQAMTEDSLVSGMERLCTSMDVATGKIPEKVALAFIRSATRPDAGDVLAWLREHPRLASLLAATRDDAERVEVTSSIQVSHEDRDVGSVVAMRPYQIGVTARCLSPLAHGADHKAGNATLFRRMDVLTSTGRTTSLPFYAANAWRGQLRDALANHLVHYLGIDNTDNGMRLSQWFFQAIYSGGALEERTSATMKKLGKVLGNNGAIRTDGVRKIRDTLPSLSLLGCSLGNKILPGRVQFGDLRPRCKQWGTGDVDVSELFDWTFLTRREDREEHAAWDHSGMIATTEVLKAGTILDGGIDYDPHAQPIELAALARGLLCLQERGRLGAENRRGLGMVELDFTDLPDPAPYDMFIAVNTVDILGFLESVEGIVKVEP